MSSTLRMSQDLSERLQEAHKYACQSPEALAFAALVRRGAPWSSAVRARLFAIAETHSVGVEYERFFALMLTGFRSPQAALSTVDFMHRLAAAAIAITRREEAPMIYGEGIYIFSGDDDAEVRRATAIAWHCRRNCSRPESVIR